MDTKFAVAVHSLILISESGDSISSDTISDTLNTNASYVRRILSSLVKAGLIISASKTRGCGLLKKPEDIRLSEIYDAVEPGVSKLNMSLFQNPNTDLIICRSEKPVIERLFEDLESSVNVILRDKTLQNLIDDINKMQAQTEDAVNEENRNIECH